MFYHARELKHVVYGKVKAFVEPDDFLIPAYKWLSNYCKFYPQIWLSRSTSSITGIKRLKNKILFGFDYIKGFSLDYSQWETALFELADKDEKKDLEDILKNYFINQNKEDDQENLKGKDRIFPTKNYEKWKKSYLFIENDQIVVPTLNLKSAKKIICRDEKQKKALRKLGFIEDRIQIQNLPTRF